MRECVCTLVHFIALFRALNVVLKSNSESRSFFIPEVRVIVQAVQPYHTVHGEHRHAS